MAAEGSTDTASDASGGMSGSGDEVQLTRVAGYFPIPIEQTMIACGEAPERRASDVLSEQGQSSQ
jgi:hypothetical protein